jgi:hypothetical protein
MPGGCPHSPGPPARILAGDGPGTTAARALVPPCRVVCPSSARAALEDQARPTAGRGRSAVGLGGARPQNGTAQEGARPGLPGRGAPPRVNRWRRRGTVDHAVRPGARGDELERAVVGRRVSLHAAPGIEDPARRDRRPHSGERGTARHTNGPPAPPCPGSRRLRGVVGQRPAWHPNGLDVGGHVGRGRPRPSGAGVAGVARGRRGAAARSRTVISAGRRHACVRVSPRAGRATDPLEPRATRAGGRRRR